MWLRVLLGWVCVLLGAADQTVLYKKVGDEVVLKPGVTLVTITTITWKDGPNIAVQWDGTDTDYYRQFKERSSLNISNGALTITGLTRDDSGWYTPEINNHPTSPRHLIVVFPVPTPTVTASCDADKSSCVLTCDGNTIGAEPVHYKWKSGDQVLSNSSKEHRITKEDSSSEFSCELVNPVSQSSHSIPNPLITNPLITRHLNIAVGVVVFLSLLGAVVLLAVFHRLKAGTWFFLKDSMPWEGDFWRRSEGHSRVEVDSNGAPQELNETTEPQV